MSRNPAQVKMTAFADFTQHLLHNSQNISYVMDFFTKFFSTVVIRTEPIVFQHLYCKTSNVLFIIVHPFPKLLFVNHCDDISHSLCSCFLFCKRSIRRPTALGFCTKRTTLSKTLERRLQIETWCLSFYFYFVSEHKLTIVFGFFFQMQTEYCLR